MKYRSTIENAESARNRIDAPYFTRTYFPTCIVQPLKLRTAKSCQV
jgi:hypothetical protein